MKKIFFSLILSLLPFFLHSQDFWQEVYTGPLEYSTLKVSANGNIYTISDSRLVSSSNNGSNWQVVYQLPAISAIFEASPTGVIYLSSDSVRKSLDEGISWITTGEGPYFSPSLMLLEADYDGNIFTETGILAGSYSYRSEDETSTWIKIGVQEAYLNSIAFDPDGITYGVYQGALPPGSKYLFKSTNKGDTWTEITTAPVNLKDIYCNYAGILYATSFTTNYLYTSADQGVTWNTVFQGKVNDIAFGEPYSPIMFIAVEDSGVYSSVDGGQSWLKDNSGLTMLAVTRLTVDSSGYLYVMTGSSISAQTKIFRSVSPALTIVSAEDPLVVDNYKLHQNYPNPFNPVTVFKYSIPQREMVTIKIFDVLGKEAATLINEIQEAGEYEVNFNASGFSTGVYFYTMKAGSFTLTRKMVLAK